MTAELTPHVVNNMECLVILLTPITLQRNTRVRNGIAVGIRLVGYQRKLVSFNIKEPLKLYHMCSALRRTFFAHIHFTTPPTIVTFVHADHTATVNDAFTEHAGIDNTQVKMAIRSFKMIFLFL